MLQEPQLFELSDSGSVGGLRFAVLLMSLNPSRQRFSDTALKAYLSMMDLGPDPDLQTRKPGLPVGLRVRPPKAYKQVLQFDTMYRTLGLPVMQTRTSR
jgi:hypothetical protein